jgi:hypothetical protein
MQRSFCSVSILLLATITLALPACASRSSRANSDITSLERRSAALRGTMENSWNAVGEAIKRGDKVDSSYVFMLGQLRQATLSLDLGTGFGPLLGTPTSELEPAVAEYEKAVAKFLALPRDQPVPVSILDFSPRR